MQKQILKFIFLLTIFFAAPDFAKAADVTACGTISSAGTYVLQNDISSPGTCMTINSGNVILDLNGHTITYNTDAGDAVYGVLITWNKVGVRVTNGFLVQGAGNGYQSNGIYSQQARSVEFDHLTMNYQGENIHGIYQSGGGFATNVNIHDNFFYPNGTKRADDTLGYPTHFGGFAAIGVYGSGGDISIVDNYIEGTGYSGISFGYASTSPLTSTLEITGNTIKMAAPVRDGYAISIASPNNDEIGFEIANNTIIQENGRGILINGYLSDSSPGPGTGTIHDNYVDVKESRDSGEYNGPGTSTGITLRFGAHNIKVFNNTVKAHAGQNACPPSFPSQLGSDCTARGLKIHASTYGLNNEIYNNIVEVDTTDASLYAAGIYAVNYSATIDNENIYHNNTVTSNSIVVDLNNTDGNGNYLLFHDNIFIRGANPLGFRTVNYGYWTSQAIENVFLNNVYQNGAGVDDITLTGSGGNNYSMYVKWYLNVSVKDADTNLPIEGAIVSAQSTGAGEETISAETDVSGDAQLVLTQFKRYGVTYPQTTNYLQYGSHEVSVSKNGYDVGTENVTMDQTQSLNFSLTPVIPDGVAPAAPVGLAVN